MTKIDATSHVNLNNLTMDPTLDQFSNQSITEDNGRSEQSSPIGAGNLTLSDVELIEIRIRNLSVSINTAPSWLEPATYPDLLRYRSNNDSYDKTLLYSVAADFQPGSLTAIIGGSGSGKTTLLDTIAERVTSSRLSYEGVTTFNGKIGVHNIRHAYVIQQDILLPTLTVRETLQYAAELRLPSSTPIDERQRIVEKVIRELGLQDCADTQIGNSRNRGCSGGEKRRVSIGVQLLANPSVLFLDEPTTGLDAASALQLVRTLKNLARKGRVVITTIHQPRSEIWDLFDNLIVLTKGSAVYSGPISNSLPWFESQGYKVPPFVNPADFIVDTAAVDPRSPQLEQESSLRVNALKVAWSLESTTRFSPLPDLSHAKHAKPRNGTTEANLITQIRVLTGRTLKVTYRDPLGMSACIVEAILIGIATGYLFYDLDRDAAGIKSRQGCLYVAATLQAYIILMFETYRVSLDMPVFDREFSEGCVSPIAFIFSRRLARLPTEDLPVPLIFSVLLYFMTGLERDVTKFFVFFAITLVNHYIAITLGTLCVVAIRHFAGASLIASLAYTIQSLCGGMVIQVQTIPVWIRWVRWIAYMFYTFGAYVTNEFQGGFYDCPYPGGPSNPACLQYTGEYILRALGFLHNWIGRPIVCMTAFVVLYIVLSILGLRYLKVEISVSRARSGDTDLFAGQEKANAQPGHERRSITVKVDRFALTVDKRGSFIGKEALHKTILRPVNATFQPGMLNVIIGPSGSGKTSLLNAMALRLRNSIGTKYHSSGRLLFNGIEPFDTVIKSVCSYVHQDDDALLPTLTVRETLRYSAALRLPSFMSTREKYQRAEEILLKMGLKDCANNLIGNELIKGISGGEKRRVSIAVQILTDPHVLLIDEPTSGLDAFTANSIIEVLRGLANEGRTIIMAIHQARSDLFDHFGNVLLLARGGESAYFGPAKDMNGYFCRYGYECPLHTNPADFALDMVTIHLNDEEAESRDRVQRLIKLWNEHQDETLDRTTDSLPSSNSAMESNEKRLGFTQNDTESNVHSEGFLSDQASGGHDQKRSLFKPFTKAHLEAPAELGAFMRKQAPFYKSLQLLLGRSIINTRRQPQLIIARLMQSSGVAIIFTLFFAPLGHDYLSIQTRMGYFQQIGGFYVIGMLTNVAVYPNERDVFYRENDDGVYGVDAFLASYSILELPFEIFNALFFGMLSVLAVGLPHTVTVYFVAVFVCFSGLSCGESLGMIFNSLFSHTGFAVNLMGVVLVVANSMAGILSINMPAVFRYFNYLSPIRYQCRALAYYSLRGLTFTCQEDQLLQNGTCPLQTGDEVLKLYKFDENPVISLVGMALCTVVYRLLAWLLLKVVRGKWRHKSLRAKK